jgi:predicted  nucleic acid-binding Zn-ribbon protein
MSVEQAGTGAHLVVRNIGGIDETEATFEPGVTVLAGRNATNRTSLLQAIMAAHGSDDVSPKADADEGHVELAIDGETYTRTVERRNGRLETSGDPYLDDPTVADLFAFLLESNQARRAVLTDADLREVIMRPIDTDEIKADVDRLLERRRQIDEQLDDLDGLKDRLPALEEERTRLQDRIEEKTAELADVEAEVEAADADVEQSREEQAELEDRLETLQERRSELDDIRYELETEQDSLDSVRADKREVDTEYGELPETPAGDIEELDARIDELRTRKQTLESELNELQSVIGFNQERLQEGDSGFLDALDDGSENADVTDELLPDETVTCWTCGSDVEAGQIEATVETLQDLSQRRVGDISEIENELDEHTSERSELQDHQRQRERLERRQTDLEDAIEDTEDRIDELTDRREAVHQEIEAIEAEIEALENDAYDEILDLHKEANQLEYDIGSLENDLDRVEENITRIEDRLDEETALDAERDAVNEEIEDLRTKIERIERQAIEEFNDRMAAVLELLEYDNLARVWLERTDREVTEGRRTVTRSIFELHVTRQTDSGATYEDAVGNLSESEREVTGLIFALAGYLAHDVYEDVPFMLLDSLEAVDATRIGSIVEYLAEVSEYLVVALLEEDAAALDDRHHAISTI